MYYLVDFARKKGSKDKQKRKVKVKLKYNPNENENLRLLGNAVALSTLGGMTGGAIRGRRFLSDPKLHLSGGTTKTDVMLDYISKGQRRGLAGGLLLGGGLVGLNALRNRQKNKKK